MSFPGVVELGILLPHLAGVIVEQVVVAAGLLPAPARAARAVRRARRAERCRAGCTAATEGGWPTRRSAAKGW